LLQTLVAQQELRSPTRSLTDGPTAITAPGLQYRAPEVLIVAALGGNALVERGESPDAELQQHHVRTAAAALATVARQHQLVVTHGNGPQVGLLSLESTTDPALSRPYPLDVLGAETQGMIGYWLLQALQNAVPEQEVASIITQTLVSAADPAFADPTKFVGPVYAASEARRLADKHGWTVKLDGPCWRRVVASPRPLRVVETRLIRQLLGIGAVVVCAGGGGAPVVRNDLGELEGVDAVVDKDTTTGLLAAALDADMLLLLTDVTAVESDYGTPEARRIDQSTPAKLRAQSFPAGSMGPKVDAACRFVELTGHPAAIGALTEIDAVLTGKAGTTVTLGGTRASSGDSRTCCP
jgi:carbamate kinase